jgi:hypothetical protein
MVFMISKKVGEPPVIIDSAKTKKSVLRLKYYYFNKGYFDIKSTYTLILLNGKEKINYEIDGNALLH